MFTGIVTDVGEIASAERRGGGLRIAVGHALAGGPVAEGESVAVAGCCLTALEPDASAFSADLSPETLSRTGGAASWGVGQRVNLERSLRAGDRLGGHIVQGHVDGRARVLAHEPLVDGSSELWVELPEDGRDLVVEKGSIALDGVSLTVASAREERFGVALIPATLAATTLGALGAQSSVNVEYDVLAKYAVQAIRAHLAAADRGR